MSNWVQIRCEQCGTLCDVEPPIVTIPTPSVAISVPSLKSVGVKITCQNAKCKHVEVKKFVTGTEFIEMDDSTQRIVGRF